MSKRHPLREPMVWLLVALPLAAVVAGIATLVIATRSGSSDAVIDPVERTAQIQTAELGPDERAGELRLSAVLQVDEGTLRLLPASGDWVADTTATAAAAGEDEDGAGSGEESRENQRRLAAERLREGTAHDQPLTLVLSHPTEARLDETHRLEPSELGWETTLPHPLDTGHDWLLQLTPADGRWRLRGRLVAGQQAARLGPMLAEP